MQVKKITKKYTCVSFLLSATVYERHHWFISLSNKCSDCDVFPIGENNSWSWRLTFISNGRQLLHL